MSETFLNSVEDMDWLRECHLKSCDYHVGHFKSAVISGNEDCPEQIDLYLEKEPLFCDIPLRLVLTEDGKYVAGD